MVCARLSIELSFFQIAGANVARTEVEQKFESFRLQRIGFFKFNLRSAILVVRSEEDAERFVQVCVLRILRGELF